MRKSRWYVLATALALTSGCTGSSGKPQVLPSLTATPTQTPTAVAIPSTAVSATPQGAEAFVRFFFDRLNAAFKASDVDLVAGLMDPACGACKGYAKSLSSDTSTVIRGNSFQVTDVAASPIQSGGSYVTVAGVIPARQLVRRDGTVLKSLPAEGRFNFTVAAERRSGGWLVRAIRINR